MDKTLEKYYKDQIEALSEARMEGTRTQRTFFQQILIVSSSILGIVISLHSSTSPHLYIRLVYLGALSLLTIGCMVTGLVLYDLAQLPDRAAKDFVSEVRSAIQASREVRPVGVLLRKRTEICEKILLFLIPFAFFLLTLYAILNCLIP